MSEKDKKEILEAMEKEVPATALPLQIVCKQNSRAVRWYVLVLPAGHKGHTKELEAEAMRRKRNGETELEFFAPTYVEVTKKSGEFVKTARPLLYNYVFVHASENDIYDMMTTRLPQYSFLPRVRDGRREYYPYLSDEAMKNMQWVASSYANVVPVYTPEPDRLMKGDRVRITEGKFKNAEATVMIQPGVGRKDIMVCIDNWMWVPLMHIAPGQYEIIGLNDEKMHVYTRLNNDRLFDGLHQALRRYHTATLTDADKALAHETLQQYGSLKMDSEVMRCKLYALLLPSYTILGDKESCDRLIGTVKGMLTAIKAEQSRALLLVTLYGCTDNSLYYNQAHQIIDPWRKDAAPKKSKLQLIRRIDDYDRWLEHCTE